MFVSPREVLSAPGSFDQTRVLNIVILAVSAISAVGAGWIILSFLILTRVQCFREVRSFRHQLILGLAISDFWMAVNFCSSTIVNLSGRLKSNQNLNKDFCNFNGFMTQLFVVQTDYWVLIIAICTFLIVADFKRQSSWIQSHRFILWSLPWGLSTLWAGLGLGLAGYGDIGAWCWFTSDRTRLLVNFIPRWLIIIVMLALYLRLYFIIYRAHTRFTSFDQEHVVGSLEPETESISSTRRIGRPNSKMAICDNGKAYGAETSGRVLQARPAHSGPAAQSGTVLRRLAYQMMSYPLVYMFLWTLPTVIRIYQASTGKPAPFAIGTIDKACIVLQGFADAVIYGINESSLTVWRHWIVRVSRRGSNTTSSLTSIDPRESEGENLRK